MLRIGIGSFFVLGGLLLTALPLEAQSYAEVGALQKNGGWDIGVSFSPQVDLNSVGDLGHYSLSGSSISDLRFVGAASSIVLTAEGLATNAGYALQIQGLIDTNGTALPTANFSFKTKTMSWAQIGANELGLDSDAVAVGDDGFDLVSGGTQFWSLYDESTYAYEQVTGDFDRKVRLEYQDPSSGYARAGLMARETLDENKPRPADPSDLNAAFSRYIEVHANPVTTAEGDAANNAYEVLVRSFTGGIGSSEDATTSLDLLDNAPPAYPDAWMRLKRQGQTFSCYRGTDGTNWVLLATYSFPTHDEIGSPVPAFPDTLYLGVNYSPEDGNIPEESGDRRAFTAQFRDYGTAEGGIEPAPTLKIAKVGDHVEISWLGTATLQQSASIPLDPWSDLSAATSPFSVTPTGNMFYRLKQ